ncbi:MAG: murein biosynthesis integral membrane protein MurJ [Patescibacteria group bacterium]|jgi:putative peptidoglycan lipid II flippase
MMRILNSKNSVKSATLILVITLTLSNILGFFRDHFLAQKIITSDLDIYYAAFRIPDLLFNIVILGAISSAFIPIFTSFIAKSEEKKAWDVANSIINIGLLVILILAFISMILMPYLVNLLVPNFDSARKLQTVSLARLFLITPIFFTLSYIVGGILNSFKRFIFYSIAPLIYNIVIIVSIFLLSPKYGITGIAIGVIIGSVLHFLIQLPGVFHLGWRYKFNLNWKDPSVRKIGKLMLPRSIGLGANQIMLFIFTALASTLAVGSVAVFSLADNIQTMPIVVFGTSFATAIFPTLSEMAAKQEKIKFAQYLSKITKIILFILIPAAVGMFMLRAEIVRLILGSGHFKWNQTMMTYSALGFFAFGLPFAGLIPVLAKAFYAKHNTKTPVIVSVISIFISIIFAYAFIKLPSTERFVCFCGQSFYGKVSGLALASSIGMFANALILMIIVIKKGWINEGQKIFASISKIILATVFMILCIQVAKNYLGLVVDMDRFWGVAIKAFGAAFVGIFSYLLAGYLLSMDEMKELSLKKLLKARLSKFNSSQYNEAREQDEY